MSKRRYRIHCHIDVLAGDAELAGLTALVALQRIAGDSDVVYFGTTGSPVDLAAMQKKFGKGAKLKFNQQKDITAYAVTPTKEE